MSYPHIAADVLAKCAANDPWFPKPSKAMALAWAEHFQHHNLERDDLLEAVRAFYDDTESGTRISPAAIVKRARNIRRDRMSRDAVPELTQATNPMPDSVRALVARFGRMPS